MSHTSGGVSIADSLRDARLALRAAFYDAAHDLLDGCEDWAAEFREQAVILKAELIGRRDPVGAVSYLATVDDLFATDAGKFALAIQFGKAHAAVRAFSQAETRFAEARALAPTAPNGLATMAYHDLRMRWFLRDYDPTAPEAAIALTHPEPSMKSAAHAWRGWLHAACGNYAAYIADLTRAVECATETGADDLDLALIVPSIHALAQAGFETANDEAVAAARRASDAIAWTPDLAQHHYFSIRAFGWHAFLSGRAGEAQWAFKDARMRAPGLAWRVMSHCDRAYVARLSRNDFWATDELAQADALAYDVPWAQTRGEERQVLVTLAVLHSATDASRAQYYASLYSQIGTENLDPTLALHGDARPMGHAHYAVGRIEQTMGRREPAVAELEKAYAIFDRAGMHYRGFQTAAALADLTANPQWRAEAERHAGAYPDSPLVVLAKHAGTINDAMPAQLSPLQRQIAAAVWNGAETAELSRRFSRSAFTIENHVTAILRAFGVESRAALLDEARQRGLI